MQQRVTVKIVDDFVIRDKEKINQIIERVSKIISNSYIREVEQET